MGSERTLGLRDHDVSHVHAASDHQHNHQTETHGDLIAHHLRGGAQSAQKMTEMTVVALSQSIASINTPTAIVTEPEYIAEFMKNCDRTLFNRIQDYVIEHKTQAEMQPVTIKCGNCQHEYPQSITLDMTSFFGRAS